MGPSRGHRYVVNVDRSPKVAYRMTVVSVVGYFLLVLMGVALIAEDMSNGRGWFLPFARVAQMLIFGSFAVFFGRRALRMKKDGRR